MADRLRIAITCGEPAGVGPEVALKAVSTGLPEGVEPVLVGPESVWRGARGLLPVGTDAGRRQTVEVSAPETADWGWGKPTEASGRIAAEAVETAARLALEGGVEALVTAPLTKRGLMAAGRPYPGHTELLEALCRKGKATMMLAGSRLRVVLVTTHAPLAKVPTLITRESVFQTVCAAHRGLEEDLGILRPRIGVAALNPHGGEEGAFGREEKTAVGPAVADARREGVDAEGPLPADSLFHRAVEGQFDAVVAMYHDQGLVALKLLHFHDGVNVTLGLPIVRTSPDHGTAFDIAGRGVARADSFREAIRWAAEIARRRKNRQ
jgi:4-hydroxythreonine-4-phosphate dehydrogenase